MGRLWLKQALEQRWLESFDRPRLSGLQYFIGPICDEREEAPVLIGLERLYEYEQRPQERELLQALAALLQDALAHVEGDIRIVEMVKKIEHQDGITLGPDVGEEVEQLIAGKRPGKADAAEHVVDGSGPAPELVHESVGGEPFAAGYGIEGTMQCHGGKQVGDALGGPAFGFDEQQTRDP